MNASGGILPVGAETAVLRLVCDIVTILQTCTKKAAAKLPTLRFGMLVYQSVALEIGCRLPHRCDEGCCQAELKLQQN